MQKVKLHKLSERIFLIDGYDVNFPDKTGTYVINEEKITLIDTCSSPSVPYIMAGLAEMNISPEQVKYIVVTHIHLDHAGAAGLLIEKCPNAKVVVHPRGARHLADPSRLIQGAKAVYGERFETLFDPIKPIHEKKIIVKHDKETLPIGENCDLVFYDTPGHANHHFSIYDPVSNGVFTGDTLGVYYPQVEEFGVQLFLPATSPNQFDPDKTIASLHKLKALQVDRIYFGHFNMTENVDEVYHQLQYWLPWYVNAGREAVQEGINSEELAERLKTFIQEKKLRASNVPDDHPIYKLLTLDLQVFAMGLIDYIQKQEKQSGLQ